MSFKLTSANTHDVTQLIALVDAVPPVAGKPGAPRRRPKSLLADKAYPCAARAVALLHRGIRPCIARRGRPGRGPRLYDRALSLYRWVVQRTISWRRQSRRLRVRYERRDDIHEAFVALGCIVIC